jgi:hemerythrin-like domain-containing protein
MDHQGLAQRTFVEQKMLKQLMDALRVTLAREEKHGDSTQRLATLRFIAQSFQRHLERMMSLEEDDGYLGWVVDENPRLDRIVAELREDHDRFRTAMQQMLHRLEHPTAGNAGQLDTLCEDLLVLLRTLDEHREKEGVLLQEAVARDGGGEG